MHNIAVKNVNEFTGPTTNSGASSFMLTPHQVILTITRKQESSQDSKYSKYWAMTDGP